MANSNRAESLVHMPWNFVQSFLSKRLNKTNIREFPIEDFSFNANELNWHAKGVSASLSGGNTHLFVGPDSWTLDRLNATSSFKIDTLSVDQIITKVIAGVVVRIHYKFSCGPILLEQNALDFNGEIVPDFFNKDLTIEFINSKVNWATDSWQINDFKCVGLNISDEITLAIKSALKNPEAFQPKLDHFLREDIGPKVATEYSKMIDGLNHYDESAKLYFKVEDVASEPTGLIASVLIHGENPNQEPPIKTVIEEADLTSLPKESTVHLLSDDVLLELLLGQIHKDSYYQRRFMNDDPDFMDLLGSTFKKLLVWPDLKHYDETSPFYLDILYPTEMSLSQQQGQSFSLAYNINALMLSFRNGRWWQYIDLKTDLKSEVSLSVQNGSVNTNCENQVLNFSASWGRAYNNEFQNSKSPPESILKASAEKVKFCQMSLQWPEIVFEDTSFSLQSAIWMRPKLFSMKYSTFDN